MVRGAYLGRNSTRDSHHSLHCNASNSTVTVEGWIIGRKRCARDRSSLNRRFECREKVDAADTARHGELIHATLRNVKHVEIYVQVCFGGA
jgi:hypothetical protein